MAIFQLKNYRFSGENFHSFWIFNGKNRENSAFRLQFAAVREGSRERDDPHGRSDGDAENSRHDRAVGVVPRPPQELDTDNIIL